MIALARGALHDALIEAETGLLLVEHPHFVVPQLLAVAITVAIERGELDAAAAHAATGEAGGITDDRGYGAEFLIARGRLRIAQGDVDGGVRGPALVRRAAAGASACAGRTTGRRSRRRRSRRSATPRPRRAWRPSSWRPPVGSALPARSAESLRAAALATGDDGTRSSCCRKRSRCSSAQPRDWSWHTRSPTSAPSCAGARRRREGRDAQRRAIELADQCGAIVLAERARADLQSGSGPPRAAAAERARARSPPRSGEPAAKPSKGTPIARSPKRCS